MKIVAAKCPNCGANIDVDENSYKTVCDYCNTKIIVSNAIKEYQLEISGSVEIKNMPKIDNYLKLGNRHYEDEEYDDALKAYNKALELEPDNYLVVLRRGLCKILETNYKKFDMNILINSFKNAYELVKNDKSKIDKCILECILVIARLEVFLSEYYVKNSKSLNLYDIEEWYSKLFNCFESYEYLYNSINSDNNELKIMLIKQIINILEDLLKSRVYYNNSNTPRSYKIKNKKVLSRTRMKYIEELNKFSPKEASKINISYSSRTWICIVFLIIFFPYGLYLMWKYKKFNLTSRIIITCIFIGLCIYIECNPEVANDISNSSNVISNNI